MKTTDILRLFDYGYWANRLVLKTAEQLTTEQFDTPVFAIGSVHTTLVHQLSADWIWRSRFQLGVSPTSWLTVEELPTLEAIHSRWQSEEAQMRAWLAGLTDEDLARAFHYKMLNGTPTGGQLGHLLLHVVNHGTQHRSEVAAMLTQLGHSPGNLDILFYLHEQPSQA